MLFRESLRNYLPLMLIILLSALLRFIWLDKIPNAISGDEIVYVLNAKAAVLTGHDIFGSWSPLNGLFFIYPKNEMQAELPYLLYMPIVGFFQFSLFTAHLTNAILSVILVVFIYLTAKELLGEQVGIMAGFAASVSPWLIYIGRTAYEATPAMLFYFIAFYVLLKAKGWKIFWAFLFLIPAFYSYIATKLIFLPFVLILILYLFFAANKRKYLKQYVSLFILCIIFILFYAVSLRIHTKTSRMGEILTPNNPQIARQVNDIRKTSIKNPFINILVNKYSVFSQIVATKTFKVFSSGYLFAYGDEFFSIWRHGLFYYVDSIFLVLGSLFLFSKKRKVFILLWALILVSILPQVLHTADIGNFTIHETMMFPFFIILIGLGIWESANLFKNKKYRLLYWLIIAGIYFISVANFFNIYAFWYPMQGYFDFPARIVSSYAVRVSPDQKITVYSNVSLDNFKKFLFYSNNYNKNTTGIIKKNLNKNIYSFKNINFVSCNSKAVASASKNNVEIVDADCGFSLPNASYLSIVRLSDGGENFRIYNDKICKGYRLRKFPYGLKLSDFNIEDLSNKDFCENFITLL